MVSVEIGRGDLSGDAAAQPAGSDLYGYLKSHVARGAASALICGMTRNRQPLTVTSRLAIVGTAAVLVLPACSGSSSKSEPATSTSSSTAGSTTTVSTTPEPRKQVAAAVRAFWDLYLELGARTGAFDASYTRARLAEHATGKELSKLFDVLQGNAAAGYVVKGTIDTAPAVVSVGRTTAQVRDCYDDKTGLYRSNGTRVDKEDPRRHKVLMTLLLERGVWKVSAIADEGLGCTV